MIDLDELERLALTANLMCARAAIGERASWRQSDWDAFEKAVSPQTILALIKLARKAQG